MTSVKLINHSSSTADWNYYRNLGIRRRTLLGVSCAVDFGLCCLLLNYSAALLHAAR